MATRAIMSFELEDRLIGEEKVAALKEMTVVPRLKGLGRKLLRLIEASAEDKIVVAFVEDSGMITFFGHCGWFIGDVFSGKTLVSSEPIDSSKHGGEVW